MRHIKLFENFDHLNESEFVVDTLTMSATPEGQVKVVDSETKKTISKQTFYGRIENLGFSKVIVNGERCFSNILAKV